MMPLEQQVSPLAESRRLKELGVAQESMLRWFWNPHGHLPFISDRFDSPLTDGECCSAFSVAELGDLLPKGLAFHRVSKTWKCEYLYASPSGALRRRGECGETMAAAAGRLLIALIEAGAGEAVSFRRWLDDLDGFVAIMFVLAMLATAVACVAGVAALLRAVMR